jgi:hypothetical protein
MFKNNAITQSPDKLVKCSRFGFVVTLRNITSLPLAPCNYLSIRSYLHPVALKCSTYAVCFSACKITCSAERTYMKLTLESFNNICRACQIWLKSNNDSGHFTLRPGSRGISVSIVSGYGLDDRAIWVRSLAEVGNSFLYRLCPHRLWGSPSLLYNGYRGSFPRL